MKKILATGLLALTLIGCNGGNGDGHGDYTHNELAKKFVKELNLDEEFDVTLVKKSTLQENFIVIYDPYTDSYDALNIDNYNPEVDNAADYYFDNSGRAFYDLDVIPGHYETEYDYTVIGYDIDGYAIWGYEPYDVWVPTRYRDRYADITFEKVAATPKDLAKVAALKEVAQLEKSAEFLSSEFGLSLTRSKEVARLSAHWKKASLKGMTAAEQDSFSTELLGFSITAGKAAVKDSMNGNSAKIEDLVESAASKNGITPEHASKLMTKVFGL